MVFFVIDWYSISYRLGRNFSGGGIFEDIREDIPPHLTTTEKEHTAIFYAELNFCKEGTEQLVLMSGRKPIKTTTLE